MINELLKDRNHIHNLFENLEKRRGYSDRLGAELSSRNPDYASCFNSTKDCEENWWETLSGRAVKMSIFHILKIDSKV